MRILTFDAALGRASAGVVVDGEVAAERIEDAQPGPKGSGPSVRLAPMAAAVLDAARLKPSDIDQVAVTLGPGSFTGLRASIALASGFALAAGRPLIGVDLAECFRAALDTEPKSGIVRILWTAIDSRRGRVFLHRGEGRFEAISLDMLPKPLAPVALAGDAAGSVAARLAAQGVATGIDVLLTDLRLPLPVHIAAASLRRFSLGDVGSGGAQPLYVDPPEAKLPRGGLRPPPQP